MKKAISLILALMLVLGLSAALAETAAKPQVIPAESADAFYGDWDIAGVIYLDTEYTPEQWGKLAGLDAAPQMHLVVSEALVTISSGDDSASTETVFNAENGTLTVKDSSGEGHIELRDDGCIVFHFSSDDNTYAVVFARTPAA